MCDRGTWNLVCKEYPYGLIYKKNFKFLGRTVSEKNAMLICKISKLFTRTIVQLWILDKISSHFSRKVCDRGTWNLVCKEYPYGLIYKKNFKFLCRTVSEKNAMLISSYHRIFLEKFQSCLLGQKKFQVPRSHSIGEKCDANFKLSSHFSRKVCDRGTWNLVCKEYPYGLIYKKNFKFLRRTV